MTQNELKKFRAVLDARQAELERLTRSREGLAIETSPDELDRIQNATEREIAVGNLEREFVLLRAVRAALRRLDTGMFGICLDCADDISPKRLAAVPWTSSCIACQQAADDASEDPENVADMELVHAA
jgi:DnaK suppressor protein